MDLNDRDEEIININNLQNVERKKISIENFIVFYMKNIKTKRIKINNKLRKFIFYLFFILLIIFIDYFILLRKIKIKDFLILKFLFRRSRLKNFLIEPEELIKDKIINSELLDKEKNEELKKIQQYMIVNLNNISLYQDYAFEKNRNPKITIVVSVYNNEKYIKSNLLSILNQDFTDIEVIVIDDGSKDKTIDIILRMILKDPRISLFMNKENKGNLYTKCKGILKARGKYVMFLDRNDFYTQHNALSTLYEEAERNNLDILGFSSIMDGNVNLYNGEYVHHFFETPILLQPNVSRRMYYNTSDGQIHRAGDVAFNYFIRSELFINIIDKIDEKYLMRKMDYHDDFLLFFLLTRNAKNIKYIKKIFDFSTNKEKNNLTTNEIIDIENSKCLDNLYYAQFLLEKKNNDFEDKKIALFELDNWYINNKCRKNNNTRDEAVDICSIFVKNDYIDKDEKRDLYIFMIENVSTILEL